MRLPFVLAMALVACATSAAPAAAQAAPVTAADSAAHWTDADWQVLQQKVRWAASGRLDTLPVGGAIARMARSFVGAPYTPGTLEQPGAERLVINLREFDCVTLVENVLALAAFARRDGTALLADRSAAQARYAAYLRAMRYRGGTIHGYASRLHYFSDWLAEGEAAGRLRLMTRELGGIEWRDPIDFMSTHASAYPALADPAALAAIRAMEARLDSAPPRVVLPKDRIAGVARLIRDGDVIAATATTRGLDVAHTGFAVWEGGQLHLLHAPLVGKSVELSPLLLADRIMGIRSQGGIMVGRPLEP